MYSIVEYNYGNISVTKYKYDENGRLSQTVENYSNGSQNISTLDYSVPGQLLITTKNAEVSPFGDSNCWQIDKYGNISQ